MTSPFRHMPGVFAHVDVEPLIEGLAWEQRSSRFYGREVAVPRLLAMYGSAYDYSGIHHPAAAIPPVLDEVRVEVEAMTGRRFNFRTPPPDPTLGCFRRTRNRRVSPRDTDAIVGC